MYSETVHLAHSVIYLYSQVVFLFIHFTSPEAAYYAYEMHSVLWLSTPPCIDRILKVCAHNILQTTYVNFTKFTTRVQSGTEIN